MAAVGPIPIIALDVPAPDRALLIVKRLGDSCGYYKIGSELFTACGPSIVDTIRYEGKRVFLDLKFHDIPNTVRAAARAAAGLGATLITVHATGGRAMIEAAVEGAGDTCRVLAVTILTSMDAPAMADAVGKPIDSVGDEVSRLARLAGDAGAHGVVCAGQEVARIRAENGARLATLVPGVRLSGDSANDQSRVVTPADAARAGATYIVLGRTVTGAQDPNSALSLVLAQLVSAADGGQTPNG